MKRIIKWPLKKIKTSIYWKWNSFNEKFKLIEIKGEFIEGLLYYTIVFFRYDFLNFSDMFAMYMPQVFETEAKRLFIILECCMATARKTIFIEMRTILRTMSIYDVT